MQWVIGPSNGRRQPPTQFSAAEALGLRAPRKPDSSDRTAWKAKTGEALFGVRGRIGATAASAKRAGMLIGQLLSALSLANGPQARLRASRQSSRTAQQLASVVGRARTWSGIVNAAELGVLLGWPVDGIAVPGALVPLGPAPRALLVSADDPEQQRDARVLGAARPRGGRGRELRSHLLPPEVQAADLPGRPLSAGG